MLLTPGMVSYENGDDGGNGGSNNGGNVTNLESSRILEL
jgi:hypothetical protein